MVVVVVVVIVVVVAVGVVIEICLICRLNVEKNQTISVQVRFLMRSNGFGFNRFLPCHNMVPLGIQARRIRTHYLTIAVDQHCCSE